MHEVPDCEAQGRPIGEFAALTLEEATHIKVYIDVGMLGLIDIESVNPYNMSHFPMGDDRWKAYDKKCSNNPAGTEKYHREGIDVVKQGLKAGKIVRPILVFNGFRRQDMLDFDKSIDWSKVRYQRLDGFKRYMAMKELGTKWIVVHVVNTWIESGQGDQPFFL